MLFNMVLEKLKLFTRIVFSLEQGQQIDKPLVKSIFNFNAHNGVTFNSVEFEGNRMLVMPSGLMINQQH